MSSLILVCLAGIFKAAMDLSAHGKPFWFVEKHHGFPRYDWWYMNRSWTYKYKNNDPLQGEKFLGSKTVFSFLCDGWHLFQFFYLNLMIAAMVCYEPMSASPIIDFVVLAVVLKGTFQLFYGTILVKK